LLQVGWNGVWGLLERAVLRGLKRKERRIPKYLSIDEKSFAKRHKYETLVCDLNRGTWSMTGIKRDWKTTTACFRPRSVDR